MGKRHSKYRVTNENLLEDVFRCLAQNDLNALIWRQLRETNLFKEETGNCTNNTGDSLEKAREVKRKQEFCEVEVSFNGETDLPRHYESCEKNPGHPEFISVDEFTIDLLPSCYQDDDLVEFIKAQSDLTVRISVKYVSRNRPWAYPNSTRPYPFYNIKETDIVRYGTGWVQSVQMFLNMKNRRCFCKECSNSQKPKSSFVYINIRTVNHLVFDDMEGENTICELFLDNNDDTNHILNVISLKGMSHVISDIESDTCQMTYVTHDVNLGKKLKEIWLRRQDIHKKIMVKYSNNFYHRIRLSSHDILKAKKEHTLTVIVSHPHGSSKKITIGSYISRDLVKGVWSRYTYTTATCCGSSGALVFVLGNGKLVFDHAHAGRCKDKSQMNFSSYGLD